MDRTQSRGAARRRAGTCALTLTYHVSANAHLGHATVNVPQSSSPVRAIVASTDVGAILIGPLS